jgi:hypothetical protein
MRVVLELFAGLGAGNKKAAASRHAENTYRSILGGMG